MEHADHATQKHDRLLGELMEHRERVGLQEQGIQQELHRLKADLYSRDGFSGVDLAQVEARFEKRLGLQEQGVQQELHQLKADLHSRDGFSGMDLAQVEARFEKRLSLQEQGIQQELHRLKAYLHSRDGFNGVDLAGVETRFEKRLEGLASNVASQMKLSRDETDQVRLLLAGVQKAWGLTIRNPRPSRKSRHMYG